MRYRRQLGSSTLIHRLLYLTGWTLALLAVLAALLLRPPPPQTAAPAAQDTREVRMLVAQVVRALRRPDLPTPIHLTQRQLDAAGRLIDHGVPAGTFDGTVGSEGLRINASLNTRLPWRWNHVPLRARLLTSASGVTLDDVRVGVIPVPGALAEWLLDGAIARIAPRSARPLDQLIPAVNSQGGQALLLTVVAPPGLETPLRTQASLALFAIDQEAVKHYVKLLDGVGAGAPRPVPLDRLTRPLFARVLARVDAGGDIVAESRAAWVALATATVRRDLMRLIAGHKQNPPGTQVTGEIMASLAGRHDLAQHLALSAAFTVLFQDRLSYAAGEWKELNDSLPGGSGFSFVDLVADRAGVRLAVSAHTPQDARAIAAFLARAGQNDLFDARIPRQFREGLSADAFKAGYGSIETPAYRARIERIDATLELLPLYRLTRRPSA